MKNEGPAPFLVRSASASLRRATSCSRAATRPSGLGGAVRAVRGEPARPGPVDAGAPAAPAAGSGAAAEALSEEGSGATRRSTPSSRSSASRRAAVSAACVRAAHAAPSRSCSW